MAHSKTTPKELMTLTVVQLKALARKNSVELESSLKADIVKELTKAMESKKKPAKKASTKKTGPKKKAAVKKKTAAAPMAGDLASLTVAELRSLARKNSLELKSNLKAEMVKELTKALMSKKEPKQKAPERKDAAQKAVPEKKPAKAREKTMAKTVTEKPKQDQGAQEKVAPKAPPPERARTSMPVGTVPPRAPEAPGKKPAAKKAEEPGPWRPKTPDTVTGNWASAIPVEPGRLFVSWDIEKGEVNNGRRLVLRVLDITETQSHGEERADSFIQVPVKSLSGGMFVKVTSGHNYRAIIGTMGMDGDFLPLIAADPITTPTGVPSEGTSLLGEEHFLSGTPSGKEPLSSY